MTWGTRIPHDPIVVSNELSVPITLSGVTFIIRLHYFSGTSCRLVADFSCLCVYSQNAIADELANCPEITWNRDRVVKIKIECRWLRFQIVLTSQFPQWGVGRGRGEGRWEAGGVCKTYRFSRSTIIIIAYTYRSDNLFVHYRTRENRVHRLCRLNHLVLFARRRALFFFRVFSFSSNNTGYAASPSTMTNNIRNHLAATARVCFGHETRLPSIIDRCRCHVTQLRTAVPNAVLQSWSDSRPLTPSPYSSTIYLPTSTHRDTSTRWLYNDYGVDGINIHHVHCGMSDPLDTKLVRNFSSPSLTLGSSPPLPFFLTVIFLTSPSTIPLYAITHESHSFRSHKRFLTVQNRFQRLSLYHSGSVSNPDSRTPLFDYGTKNVGRKTADHIVRHCFRTRNPKRGERGSSPLVFK